MDDKLGFIFEMQQKFDTHVRQSRNLPAYTRDEWVQKKCLALFTEISEVLEEVNWKWWKNEKEIDYSKAKEEMIDVLHFFVSLSLDLGMDENELFERYLKKNKENFDRQAGFSAKKGYSLDEAKD